MRRMGAETGDWVSVQAHYDALIDEGNDPVLDPPILKAYMDGWDGETFFELLALEPRLRALEIGIGTGRLALKALEAGCVLVGMDVSEKTLKAAERNLAGYEQVRLIRGEFPADAPSGSFERIYSSLTFMHIADKRAAVEKISALLALGGRAVLSLDKSRDCALDMGNRRVRVYPDDPEETAEAFRACGLTAGVREIERAWLIWAQR